MTPQTRSRGLKLWLALMLVAVAADAQAQVCSRVLSGVHLVVLGQTQDVEEAANDSTSQSEPGSSDEEDADGTQSEAGDKTVSKDTKADDLQTEKTDKEEAAQEEAAQEVPEGGADSALSVGAPSVESESVEEKTAESQTNKPNELGSKESHTEGQAEAESNAAPELSAEDSDVESTIPSPQQPWPTLPKSGLRGWGLGVDIPMSGILAGNATSSSHGVGYTLGLGLGYEVVRGWVLRLALTGGETSRGEATIQYLDGGIPLTRSFEAEWLGVELGLGLQRIFKDFDPLIWPYVGVEAGPVFSGYYYRFDSAAVSTLATNDETTRYGANEYEAVGLGWAGKLSGGVRIELMPGIEWGTEYSLSLTTVSELEPVSNTRQIREVFPIQEWIFQHRLIIGLWLGL